MNAHLILVDGVWEDGEVAIGSWPVVLGFVKMRVGCLMHVRGGATTTLVVHDVSGWFWILDF